MSNDERVIVAIDAMTREVMSGPDIYRPSRFWEELNERNRRQIVEIGLSSFKRTVNQNYFNFLIVGRAIPSSGDCSVRGSAGRDRPSSAPAW